MVIPEVVIPKSEYDYKRETTSACILQNVVAEARLNGVQVKSLHRCIRDPYRAIIDTAEHEGCDLIVMGSDCDAGLVGTLLGSETTKVVTRMPACPYWRLSSSPGYLIAVSCRLTRLDQFQLGVLSVPSREKAVTIGRPRVSSCPTKFEAKARRICGASAAGRPADGHWESVTETGQQL